jgi:signal transduction histidine kinase
MPRSLEEGSLVEAIEELVKRLQLVCDIEFIYSNKILNLNKENKINLYRIIQEFVNNSMKHAANSRIEIHMSVNQNSINLLLKDNGKGFDIGQSKFGKGIYNIKSRINALNAEHNFVSELNKGTYLELFIKEVL